MSSHQSKAELLLHLENKKRLAEGLPFLYGWKWYKWARDFFESTNKINLLCAANQISKSSTQIRKCIDWATNREKWDELWIRPPSQFWYLYPSQKVVNAEWLTKWSQFMPKGEFKKDPRYGWEEIKKHGDTIGIKFNSGVYVFFKTYAQSSADLQTGTCDAIFCDEELPADLYDELMLRISASDGYFNMVFTATLGQDQWRRAMEPKNTEAEFLPDAFKQTVSLYDAMEYDDGTKSHWTLEKISTIKARCGTEAEVLKRVYGRFVVVGGRIYEAFDITRHLKTKHPIPEDWLIYVGADIGSGGDTGHPAALCYVAVKPDFRAGRVFLGWRGDNISTTAGDVVSKHLELKKTKNLKTTDQRYDWSSSDFFQIASGMGETFNKANKAHDVGENILNTLFKNDMLYIYEDEELVKLAGELSALLHDTPKRKAKDDFADALRYAVATIPWDFSWLTGTVKQHVDTPEKKLNAKEQEIADRRKAFFPDEWDGTEDIEKEFEDWNEAYGN